MRQVGDIVQLAHITHDERDKLITTPRAPMKIVRLNTAIVPHRSYDYEIVSLSSGNHFYVYECEIEDYVK